MAEMASSADWQLCVRSSPQADSLELAKKLILKLAAGAPDRIRTCDLRLRRATLYPAELRVLSAYAMLTRKKLRCEPNPRIHLSY